MGEKHYLDRKNKEQEYLAQPVVRLQQEKQREELQKLRNQLASQFCKVKAYGK